MAGSSPGAALPYKEPGIIAILTQASFIILLNITNHFLNNLVYCGLIGQVFVGVAWGTPGAKWLTAEVENVFVELGYIGLILLVFEGGLSTSFSSLKANVLLSTGVAVTGICLPIALSFLLISLVVATPLQAFAAGAALCSTSLGTTLTVLSACGLTRTRLGIVLTSAAIMDDVVGLIMIQVISNLGATKSSFSSIDVIRPIAVSVALVVAVLLFSRFCVQPATLMLNKRRAQNSNGSLQRICQSRQTVLAMHTTILLCLVAGASFAGTSNLFAAYLAGASISWWDSEIEHPGVQRQQVPSSSLDNPKGAYRNLPPAIDEPNLIPSTGDSITDERDQISDTGHPPPDQDLCRPALQATAIDFVSNREANEYPLLATVSEAESYSLSGTAIYGRYYLNIVERLLKPFFFASIGFSIPISRMFNGAVVWRGIVYTLFMLFGKLLTGIWLVRFTAPSVSIGWGSLLRMLSRITKLRLEAREKATAHDASTIPNENRSTSDLAQTNSISMKVVQTPPTANTMFTSQPNFKETSQDPQPSASSPRIQLQPEPRNTSKPLSLYPASILGAAMTARGEIGFLIASIAESNGVFANSRNSERENSEMYLVVIWAIVLCTIIGPLSVGVLVKRIKRLQSGQSGSLGGAADPLGVWGIT